ncbi:hypothetical protein QUF90_27600, partial [Desulfococcaceae bacterium HSG9]|nr:hypothetical protein [Desulfococcaceae bacterium HSG9]
MIKMHRPELLCYISSDSIPYDSHFGFKPAIAAFQAENFKSQKSSYSESDMISLSFFRPASAAFHTT